MTNNHNTASGHCLAKVFSDHPSILDFLKVLKSHNIPDPVDRHIYTALGTYYDDKTRRVSPLWYDKMKQVHRDRIEVLKQVDVPFDKDFKEICANIVNDFGDCMVDKAIAVMAEGRENGRTHSSVISQARGFFDQAEICNEESYIWLEDKMTPTIQGIMDRLESNKSISSGFYLLDWQLGGGFEPGEFVVISSMTGQGKTMFMQQMAASLCKQNMKIAIIGLEMSDEEYIERWLSQTALQKEKRTITGSSIRSPLEKLDPDELLEMRDEVLKDLGKNIVFLQPKMINVEELKTQCKIAVNQHKVDAIFLDHMLLVDGRDQRETVEDISNFMKAFATENNIISFAVSQMNRDTDMFNPKVSNMSGGRTIEHTATTLITIGKHKKEEDVSIRYGKQGEPEEDSNLRKIQVLKARAAPSDTWFLANFRGNNASFECIKPCNWDEVKDSSPNEEKLYYKDY